MWEILVQLKSQSLVFETCSSYAEACKVFHETIHKFPNEMFSMAFNTTKIEVADVQCDQSLRAS